MDVQLGIKVTGDDGTVILDVPISYSGMDMAHVLAVEVLEAKKIQTLTTYGIQLALSKNAITQEYAEWLLAELNKPVEIPDFPVMKPAASDRNCCKK